MKKTKSKIKSTIILWDHKANAPVKTIVKTTVEIRKQAGNCVIYDEVNTWDDNVGILLSSRKGLNEEQVDLMYSLGELVPFFNDGDEENQEQIASVIKELKELGLDVSTEEFE